MEDLKQAVLALHESSWGVLTTVRKNVVGSIASFGLLQSFRNFFLVDGHLLDSITAS